MSELVAESLSEYEAMALKIAKGLRPKLRERLVRNRQIHALFNTADFTCHLKSVYEKM
jgi:predicted O-linked N-acetylglucosamine transferase (SPINDLY family)